MERAEINIFSKIIFIRYDHGGLCKSPNYKAHVFINDLRKSEKQI